MVSDTTAPRTYRLQLYATSDLQRVKPMMGFDTTDISIQMASVNGKRSFSDPYLPDSGLQRSFHELR